MALRIYLIVYFAVLAIALVVLWQGRVLARLPFDWVAIVFVVAVALGVLLAVVSRRDRPHTLA